LLSLSLVSLGFVMTLVVETETVPLKTNADGVVRVGKTRVTLDTVINAFQNGATAEEIAYRFPSLNLADVYATISFYLNHQADVEVYLQQRQGEAQKVRKQNQSRFDSQGLRDRLMSRRIEQSL